MCWGVLCFREFMSQWSRCKGERKIAVKRQSYSDYCLSLPRETSLLALLRRLRKMRDSNPRYPKGVYRISSPAHSITLPIFQMRCKGNNKITNTRISSDIFLIRATLMRTRRGQNGLFQLSCCAFSRCVMENSIGDNGLRHVLKITRFFLFSY